MGSFTRKARRTLVPPERRQQTVRAAAAFAADSDDTRSRHAIAHAKAELRKISARITVETEQATQRVFSTLAEYIPDASLPALDELCAELMAIEKLPTGASISERAGALLEKFRTEQCALTPWRPLPQAADRERIAHEAAQGTDEIVSSKIRTFVERTGKSQRPST